VEDQHIGSGKASCSSKTSPKRLILRKNPILSLPYRGKTADFLNKKGRKPLKAGLKTCSFSTVW
jgi:hypothetical protein